MLPKYVVGASLIAVTIAACKPATAPPAATTPGGTTPPAAEADRTTPGNTITPTAASSYTPFTQAAYDAARASGQPTMLYFYATWCPICARQEPIIVDLFRSGEIADYSITALRVNFNDPDTDADERALADRFGISYQHTFVLLDANGAVKAKFSGHQTKEQLKAALGKISSK